MADRDPFDLVEMSPGAQPPAGFGDRVLVGLALIALLSGAVIAVVNFIPDSDQVAQASIDPSAEPSGTPPPPPTPAPPRVATIEDPDINISPPENWYGFDGWIRASVDLVIYSDRDLGSTQAGVLKQGDVAYASTNGESDTVLGWLYLQDHSGWVTTKVDGQVLARRYEYPQTRGSGWIDSLTAGPDGFLAMVTPPQGPSDPEPTRPMISADGATWRSGAASAFGGQWVAGIAHGPSGWLAAGGVNDGSTERIFFWGSPDGLSWSRLGMLSGMDDSWVDQLRGSETGYLLQTQSGRGTSTLWASADGLAWTESPGPTPFYGGNRYRRIASLAGGFYTWGDGPPAFSTDGQTWLSADDGPDGLNLRLADLGGQIFAIDLDRGTLVPRVWSGFIARGRLGWRRLEQSEPSFADAVVTQLVSDGRLLFAFGWDRSTEEPLVWTGDGARWSRSPLPEAFGGIPTMAAAGPEGVAAIGYRRTLRGDNPIIWHRTAPGGWLPEPNPALARVPDPVGDECPALPADLLELSVVDAAGVVSCHADAPITFEGLSVRCEGCAGMADGNPQPAWLMNAYTNVIYMSPVETNTGWQTTLTLGPSLRLDPAWMDHRLRVTGHYDDPAALTCHQDVNADSVEWWTGQQAIINGCRQTFVVTDVTVLPGL